MAELKTKRTTKSPSAFIKSIKDANKRADSAELIRIFKEATGEKPVMWGSSIIGYGSYHYKSERSSQEGDWPLTGFSPRAQNLTLYIMPGFSKYGALLKKLGPHKKSVGCLYIKRLSDTHIPTLKTLIKRAVADMRMKYKAT